MQADAGLRRDGQGIEELGKADRPDADDDLDVGRSELKRPEGISGD